MLHGVTAIINTVYFKYPLLFNIKLHYYQMLLHRSHSHIDTINSRIPSSILKHSINNP